MWPTGSRGRILVENKSFGRFSTGPHRQDTQQLLAEFWTPLDWPTYRLSLLDLTVWCVLQAKSQAISHADLDALHLSIVAGWDRLTAEHIRRICLLFGRHRLAIAKKNGVEIE